MGSVLIVLAVFLPSQRGPDGIRRTVRDDGSVISSTKVLSKGEKKEILRNIKDFTPSQGSGGMRTLTPWPKFRHDLNNTGYTTSPAPSTASLNWMSSPLMDVVSSPAITDNKVFFGVFGFPGWVVCLDEYTGDEIWHFVPPHLDYVNSSPAVKYGRVYIGDRNGYLWCLDEETGDTLWYYHANNGIDGGIAVDDSIVFFGSMRGNPSPPYSIYALDAFTGELVWGYDPGEAMVGGTPAVTESSVIVGTCESSNNVYCFEKHTGDVLWQFSESAPMGWVESSPSLYQGKVYVGSTSGKLYCLDLSTGDKVWEFNLGWWITSSPGVHDGKVFFGAYDGRVYALPATDPNGDGVIDPSEVLWTFTTGDLIGQSSPAIASGMVFIGSYDGKIYALDEETGNLVWSYQTGEAVLSSPAIADGMLFIGSGDDTLYAFGTPTDITERRRIDLSSPILSLSPFPNPFSSRTTFTFSIPKASRVNLGIYDLSGRLISPIFRGFMERGKHTITWGPRRALQTGVYMVLLKTEEKNVREGIMFLKRDVTNE